MTKYTPIKLTQLSSNESAAVDAINRNLDAIKESIDDSISRSAKTPSQLTADLDLNGHKILNTGTPSNPTDLVRQQDVVADKAEIKQMHDDVMVTGERILNAAEVTDEKVQEAANAAALAEQWATKTDGPVADGEYSAKYYAEQIGADVATVAAIATDVTAVAENETNVNAVASNMTNVNAVADNETNINAVNANKTNIDNLATNMADINDCSGNMAAIQDAPTQAANAAASAEQAAISAAGTHFKLFHHNWFDYELDDMAWLRADTFSWQDGTVYTNAYNHLVNDYENNLVIRHYIEAGGTIRNRNPQYDAPLTDSHPYAWTTINMSGTIVVIYTDTETPAIDDYSYSYSNRDEPALNITNVGSSYEYTETIGSYTITYYLSSDGHKIILPEQETAASNIYAESGVAWYYLLDQTNQRFKLPRENPSRNELLQTVGVRGNGIALGLEGSDSSSNMTYNAVQVGSSNQFVQNTSNYGKKVGATQTGNTGSFATQKAIGVTEDVENSGMVADFSSYTSINRGKNYLYFYVGQFTQTATEQTAGLNAELFNGKADIDLSNAASNASDGAKATIVGWGIPDYSAGISTTISTTTQYMVPSNGCITATANNSSTQIGLSINGITVQSTNKLYTDAQYIVSKRDIIKTTNSNTTIIFYPLKGTANA